MPLSSSLLSAGVGRTGTLITIDIESQRVQKEKAVDPFNTVTQLRQQRNHMVQTEAQYVFLHDAILEEANSGNTEMTVEKLSQRMAELEKVDEDEESGYKKEFQVCKSSVNPFLVADISMLRVNPQSFATWLVLYLEVPLFCVFPLWHIAIA